MKFKIIFLIGYLLLIGYSSFSQSKQFIYYFDADFNPVKASKAIFTGTGIKENGLVKVSIIENKSQKTIMIANYTDSSLNINEGLYQSFFLNGKKASEGNYLKGLEIGLWEKWDSLGYLFDSSHFENGKKIDSTTFSYHKNHSLALYNFSNLKNDTQEKKHYNDSGKLMSITTFKGQEGVIKSVENGKEEIKLVHTREEIQASFPGGDAGWNKYIVGVITKNMNQLIEAAQAGTVRVAFTIDTDGSISNVRALNMKGTVLANIAVDAIANGPRWIPAKHYGNYYKAYREQPITFTIENGRKNR